MRTIRTLICCLLLSAFALSQRAHERSGSQEGKILALENIWNQAQHRYAGAVEALIADRFVNTEYDGQVTDRDQFLADIKDPKFKATAVGLQDMKANVYRETAVVTGIYHTKGSYNGKSYDHLGRFTDTDGNVWLAIQAWLRSSYEIPQFRLQEHPRS